jgi:ABC-type transport system substrate-binding protein
MNNLSKPFDDVRVRLAVALSVNRQRLVDTFYPAGTSVAHSFVPCAITFGCAGDAWYEQDIAQAKELLAEAGFPNGFATTILVRDLVTSHTPYPKEIAQDLQDQLLEIGIKTKIEVLESTTWIDRLISGKNVGLGVGGGWVADYPDPTNYLDFFFRADSGGSARFGAPYSDVSEILVKAAQATDATKREALYAEANNLIKANVPMVPVVQTGSGIAYRADVLGANASPLELENLAVLQPGNRDQLVWVIPSEPSSLYCQGAPGGQDPLRICAQISESLYGFVDGSAELKPVLATGCTGSENGSTWTCKLRKNVIFHDGSQFDATDVVDSFAVQWDCAHPWRLKTESYYYFPLLSGFLNKASCSAE